MYVCVCVCVWERDWLILAFYSSQKNPISPLCSWHFWWIQCYILNVMDWFCFSQIQRTIINLAVKTHPVGFLGGSAGNSTHSARDLGSISGLGISPREGKDYPLQYYGLENSMDYIVHGVAKSRTQLSNFHFQRYIVTHTFSWFP